MPKPEIIGSYDELADVAYFSVGEPDRRDRTREGPNGVLWRVSPDGEYRGATVLNFNRLWQGRENELLQLLLTTVPVGKGARKRLMEMI